MHDLPGKRCSQVILAYKSAIAVACAVVSLIVGTPAIANSQIRSVPGLTVLYNFTGGADGRYGGGGLIRDSAGNLYGTAFSGGNLNCQDLGSGGCGVVYKVAPSGIETVLHAFDGVEGQDGDRGATTLIQDSDGNLYGTTLVGGNPAGCLGVGCGTVFKVDPSGNETVLYRFMGQNGDGALPEGGLVRDTAGNLYGVTYVGGGLGSCSELEVNGCGSIFKIDPSGNETVLYRFTGGTDGGQPEGILLLDGSGNLYGTAQEGGDTSGPCASLEPFSQGCGTVFKLNTSDELTVLHTFSGLDGGDPIAGLAMDSAGNLYGTTAQGGTGSCQGEYGCGTVFKLTPNGTETVLHNFIGSDGAYPEATLLADGQGNWYGTVNAGGMYGAYGGVFEITSGGNFIPIFFMTGDVSEPWNLDFSLVRDAQGHLYTASDDGGAYNAGAVFEITP